MKAEKEDAEWKECTFKPSINRNSSRMVAARATSRAQVSPARA